MSAKKKVLLIGWDAADWKVIDPLVDRGEMPFLARFLEEGVMGDITTLDPVLSPMLWNSIGTGKRADQHGILGFTEVDPDTGGIRPISSYSRKVKALWNILMQEGYRSHVIGWFGGHPAEPIDGVCVSDAFTRQTAAHGDDWPLVPGTISPKELEDTLGELRMKPEEITAELLTLFVPNAAKVDQDTDRHLEMLAKLQAEMISIHAAATWAMEHEPWDFTAIYYGSIDHFSHGFMDFHPPRLEHIPEEQFALYHDVVNSAYRFHDLMLGRLLELAGDDTTVILVSDHGYHSDHLRPREIPRVHAGPAICHRPLGIFAMKGPGVRKDERLYGVNLLDVTPTVLRLFDLPVGSDMEGRVLVEAFESALEIETIPSWEEVDGEDGMHGESTRMDPEEAEALLQQFVDLGYIEKPGQDKAAAVEGCLREQKWNLARVYLESARWDEALPLLEQIFDEVPERSDFALALARCQLRVGLFNQAEQTVQTFHETHPEFPATSLLLGNIAMERGNWPESLEHLTKAQEADPKSATVHAMIARTYLFLRQWEKALDACERAIAIDPHDPLAHLGQCIAYLRLGKTQEAAEAGLHAVGLQYQLPLAHYYLGVALTRLEIHDRAIQAFETALRLRPRVWAAHRWLVRIYRTLGGHGEELATHRKELAHRLDERREKIGKLALLRRDAAERAVQRAEFREQRRKERQEALVASGEPDEEAAPAQSPSPLQDTKRVTEDDEPLVLVSGLPRSGTSLMMQMLEAGGMPILTDGERLADDDNPRGYYEWEPIKKIRENPDLLDEARGKATKVISMLLPALPANRRYRVIFMTRPLDEVVASQSRMLERNDRRGGATDPGKFAKTLRTHRDSVRRGLGSSEQFEVLEVDYPDLVRDPAAWAARIIEFVGAAHLPSADQMPGVIRPELHRQQSELAAECA